MDKRTPILAQSEIEELRKMANQSGSLYRLSKMDEFSALNELFNETIKLLKDITTIDKDSNKEVQFEARNIAINFLEGLMDSIGGAEQNLEFYSKVEKPKEQKTYGRTKSTLRK